MCSPPCNSIPTPSLDQSLLATIPERSWGQSKDLKTSKGIAVPTKHTRCIPVHLKMRGDPLELTNMKAPNSYSLQGHESAISAANRNTRKIQKRLTRALDGGWQGQTRLQQLLMLWASSQELHATSAKNGRERLREQPWWGWDGWVKIQDLNL